MSKTIKIDLFDSRSIRKAVNSVRDYEKEFLKACTRALEALTERGVNVAKIAIVAFGAVGYTGNLEAGIQGLFNSATRQGIIFSDTYYAAFVEYGTGIVGELMPHPEAEEDGWQYDINNHGAEGWLYYNENDGKRHRTWGYVARPFLYETRLQLEQEAPEVYRRMFENIR